MADKQKRTILLAAAAVLCLVCVIAVVLYSSRGNPPTNPVGAPTVPNPPNGGTPPPGGWTVYQARQDLMIKAEDTKQLLDKMKLDTALDNEKVLDSAGRRAQVTFVEVPDETCEKGKESDSKAMFTLTVEQPGTYYPWARVWWQDSCADSMLIRLRHETAQKPLEFVITDGTYTFWHWVAVTGSKGVKLERGTYEVVVENREDGARLSRILFATQDYETHMPTTPDD